MVHWPSSSCGQQKCQSLFSSFPAPEVLIVDEQGLPLYEKFYNLDSLLELVCIVRHITMTTSVVYWLHGDLSLNYDTTRGGTRWRPFSSSVSLSCLVVFPQPHTHPPFCFQCANRFDRGGCELHAVHGPSQAIRLRQLYLLHWTKFILHNFRSRTKR